VNAPPPPAPRQRSSAFSSRDFRLLFAGSSISAIGDQFTLVALPWLVLELTGDPAQLGIVLAVMAVPRAAFMLVGGALVDRLSPRRVLLSARIVNALLTGLLAALVLLGDISMPALYALAVGIGLSTAFAYPAAGSLLPQLVPPEQLQGANSSLMGMRQLSMLVGPALAGLLIRAGSAAAGGTRGTGLAFAVDAVSFLFSVGSLCMIRVASDRQPRTASAGVLVKVGEGLRAHWRDPQLRAFISYMALVSVLVGGPLQVCLPLLARTRLSEGAAGYGILMTSYGAGMLLGSLASVPVTRLARGQLGLMVLGVDALNGLAFAALAAIHSLPLAVGLLLLVGTFAGTVQIAVITWLQHRVPQAMLGRTMSLVMFTFMGLAPLAAAAAGGLLKVAPLADVLAIAGLTLTAVALFCLTRPSLRAIALRAPEPG
jgi:MFS family permease